MYHSVMREGGKEGRKLLEDKKWARKTPVEMAGRYEDYSITAFKAVQNSKEMDESKRWMKASLSQWGQRKEEGKESTGFGK